MSNELKDEIRNWSIAVEIETARLIRLGMPPWDAAIRARQRIEKKRRLSCVSGNEEAATARRMVRKGWMPPRKSR